MTLRPVRARQPSRRPLLGGAPRAQPEHRDRVRRRALRRPARGPIGGGSSRGAGPARARRSPRPRRSPRTASRSRTAITRDMLGVICRLGIEQDDQRFDLLRVVDQMDGPQIAPAAARPVPAGRHAGAARGASSPGCTPTRRTWPPTSSSSREGRAIGLTAPRIVAERTIAQLERLLAIPAECVADRRDGQVAGEADRDRVRDAVRDVVYPADRGLPRGAPRRLPARPPARIPGSGRRPTASSCTGPRSGPGRRSTSSPAEVHRIGLEELAAIEDERRAIARGAGFGDDTRRLPRAPRRRPGQPRRRTRTSCSSAPARRSSARSRSRRATSAAAAGRLRRPGGRAVQGEGRAVRLLLPARRRRAPARASTTSTRYDLPQPAATSTLATTTFHEAVPGHHFQIALEMENPEPQHLPAPRRPHGRRRLRRGLGPLRRAPRRRDGPLPQRARSASGCSTRRPGGRPGSSSTPASMRLRWTRQQSIDFLLEAGLSETDAIIETDRYICLPAQALTYKVGQREIETLRRELDGARRCAVRPAGVPRRGAGPRLAAAGDARPRAAALGARAGLSAAAARSPLRRCVSRRQLGASVRSPRARRS